MTQPMKPEKPRKRVWGVAALLTVIFGLVTGCQTTESLDTAKVRSGKTIREITCAPWRKFSEYDVTKVAPLTDWEIRVHNQTGRNLRCWK